VFGYDVSWGLDVVLWLDQIAMRPIPLRL